MLMTVSQEGCQHGADNSGLGELVKFSAEPQLAELRCLDGGVQGISLGAAGAGSSGSAAAVFRTIRRLYGDARGRVYALLLVQRAARSHVE